MIDATRLSHSLTTALKDRPHGIPVQPNRSLPLRPPPPLPIRIPPIKSPKNSPVTQVPVSQKSARNTGTGDNRSHIHGASVNGNNGDNRKEDLKNDRASRGLGIKFYDSKDKEDSSNDKSVSSAPKIPKELDKSRHTKSLDNEEPEKRSSSDTRRKSLEHEAISRHGYSRKRHSHDFDWPSGTKVPRDRERGVFTTKKRKSSSTEENCELSRTGKSTKLHNADEANLSLNFKHDSDVEAGTEPEKTTTKSTNFERVESPGMDLPVIYKYRNSEINPLYFSERNRKSEKPDTMEKPILKQTRSHMFTLTLPNPPNIPKCPVAIPIELAHAINQGASRNSKINLAATDRTKTKSHTPNFRPAVTKHVPIKPKINIKTEKAHIPKTAEEIENTLPSMPSLEDIQADMIQDNLILPKNEGNCQKNESNVSKESGPVAEQKVVQILGDVTSKTKSLQLASNDQIQEDVELMNDQKFIQPQANDSRVNLTTVLEIQISGSSPDLIILSTPQVMPNGNRGGIGNSSPAKATTPVEESRIDAELTKADTYDGLREIEEKNQPQYQPEIGLVDKSLMASDRKQQCEDFARKDEPQYVLQVKNPGEFEVRINDAYGLVQVQAEDKGSPDGGLSGKKPRKNTKKSQAGSKADESILRCRKNRLNLKLQKFYDEEARLKCKMSQTRNATRLTRLQQRINCAVKKIENTQKYLNKLISIENPGLYTNSSPSRIQVRRDLVQKIPSPESVEPAAKSPLGPIDEIDKASIERNTPVLSPDVITILESDSASSSEETEASDEKLTEHVKLDCDSDAKMKYEANNTVENDAKAVYTDLSPAPRDDYKADNCSNELVAEDLSVHSAQFKEDPKITNNNVEYLNKNLPPVCEGTSAGENKALKSIPPLVRDIRNFSPSNQYRTQNISLMTNKVDKEQIKPNCGCLPCLQGNSAMAATNMGHLDANNYIPLTVNEPSIPNPILIRRTDGQENPNIQSVPNYPAHNTDYRTTGNASSMFSKDNGGANINLSSPLQGHSALPLPPSYYPNLTAQGYSVPTESSSNHQTTQLHAQHPVATQSSGQFTPDQDAAMHSSILVAHLLQSQVQEPTSYSSSIKLSNLAKSKETARTEPTKHISNRIMAEPFPTLGIWAAQITSDPVIRKPVGNGTAAPINIRPKIDHGNNYKTIGSDMYKMTATATDTRHPAALPNTIHRVPGSNWPEKQVLAQGYPTQRSHPQPYRREHPGNLQIPKSSHGTPPAYPGSEVFVPHATHQYQQIPSVSQSMRGTEHSGSQPSQVHQNAQQYYSTTSSVRSSIPAAYQNQGTTQGVHLANSGMLPQQYVQHSSQYVQAMYSSWHLANNYHKNYGIPQFNGYNIQPKPVDNPTRYTPMNKSIAPMQQQRHDTMTGRLIQNASNVKLPTPIYNMPAALSAVVQEGRKVEPLNLGRSCAAPHSGRVRKSLDNRTTALRCSLCGTSGPRFNCFGCETAFYCNEQCQAQHWSTHFKECPKKMPKLNKVS